jgi:tRNA (adenine57-N1/adenine58-N1)-methyltransferase
MVGHTGFLATARRLADGVRPPARRRRPAKGSQPGRPASDRQSEADEPTPLD